MRIRGFLLVLALALTLPASVFAATPADYAAGEAAVWDLLRR